MSSVTCTTRAGRSGRLRLVAVRSRAARCGADCSVRTHLLDLHY